MKLPKLDELFDPPFRSWDCIRIFIWMDMARGVRYLLLNVLKLKHFGPWVSSNFKVNNCNYGVVFLLRLA
jgi:hypothetical protein